MNFLFQLFCFSAFFFGQTPFSPFISFSPISFFQLPHFLPGTHFNPSQLFIMSHSRDGSVRFSRGKMLSPEVCLIGERSNDDPSHHHDDSNAASDQESSVPLGGTAIIGGVVHPGAGATTPAGGTTATEGEPCPNIRVHSISREDEAESPLPSSPHNVINLELEATTIQVLVCHPFIPPPPRKPSKVRKEYPSITLTGYSQSGS